MALPDDFNNNDINNLINSAWANDEIIKSVLRNKFDERLLELDISTNQAVENLEIPIRTLDGILDGTLKQVDFFSLLKVAQFLEISFDEITALYVQATTTKHKVELELSRRRSFIINNFDLPALKSIGVIDSIRDFNHIEQRIKEIFDLKNITDFDIEDTGAAFSSGARLPKNLNSRKYFISEAKMIFKLINNPNPYDKDAVASYFPNIRWHSLDLEEGLISVIRSLYKVGVTVIFRPKMPKLQMRGATFSVNNKPCIVLTDYRGLYPTLYFALVHELFHVIFDWEEISKKKYHLSVEGNDPFVIESKEREANEFARDFMFSKKKMELVSERINERLFVRETAIDSQVHPSVIYANYAYDNSSEDDKYFMLFRDYFPPFKTLLKKLGAAFEHASKNKDIAIFYKTTVFN